FFHPLGRHALDPSIKKACQITSILFLISITGLILFLMKFGAISLLTSLISLMLIPITYNTLLFKNKKFKRYLILFNIALLLCGFATVLLVSLEDRLGVDLFKVFNY